MTSAEHTIGDLLNEHNRLTLDVIRGNHTPIAKMLLVQNEKLRARLAKLRGKRDDQ
ncbi:hypothetical protein [Lacticaseibacillus paracasei]|uniref:hypothetical protein n=1 Tax=Lacticaseibacillus paracasei TaxID=1597 RepID=UPI0017872D44|nr:hypothetical protein [Lacticaseibacillus paracasei]